MGRRVKPTGASGSEPRKPGRPHGVKNEATQERETRLSEAMRIAAETLGEDKIDLMSPREVIEFTMRLAAKAGWWFRAAELANMVAPYVHPKLQSTTLTNGNADESRSDVDLAAELEEIRNRQSAADRARALAARVSQKNDELGHSGTLDTSTDTGPASRTAVH